MHFDENPFRCQCKREDKKASVFQFRALTVVFNWHHGSEGVNVVNGGGQWPMAETAHRWTYLQCRSARTRSL